MTVPNGHMILYDRIDPPLPQGRYRFEVDTTVTLPEPASTTGTPLDGDVRYFDVEGPRFRLAPTEVAGVFPPRNGHGPFSNALPHVALGRRTLPWERLLDPAGRLPAPPARSSSDPPVLTEAPPWLALLLFEESEILEVLKDVPVANVLPESIATDLGVPEGAKCDAIEVHRAVLGNLLPTVEELSLLTHVREVNVDDRELSAGDSDGWFAVVMSNRIPAANRKYRACLVSVEGRGDLLQVEPPPVVSGGIVVNPDRFFEEASAANARADERLSAGERLRFESVRAAAIHRTGPILTESERRSAIGMQYVPEHVFHPPPVRLILMHSWTFETNGIASFEELAKQLDVGLMGEVRGEHPVVTDTGHLPVELKDRAGARQAVWYRGPLTPFPVTRDERGPYHSADQCRRVSPETGMEDISYAAAFEVGRLLAASDARLAQELMRWRRVDYRRSVDRSLQDALRTRFESMVDMQELLLSRITGELVRPWLGPNVRRIDPLELDLVRFAPGLDPMRIAEAWSIAPELASRMLAAEVRAVGTMVDRGEGFVGGSVSLADVRADKGLINRLARLRAIDIERGGFDGSR